jgi:replicative DNA helicase
MSRKDKKDRNGKPELRDLRDSGRIEEDADVVLAPYYEWRDDMNSTEKKNKVELYILKQRNGSIGMVPMIFEYRYISLKEDEEMPEEGDE